jgi:hypothetical protein
MTITIILPGFTRHMDFQLQDMTSGPSWLWIQPAPLGKPDIHHPRGAQGQALRGLGEAKVRQGRKGDGPRFDENGPGPCKLHGECAKGHIYI